MKILHGHAAVREELCLTMSLDNSGKTRYRIDARVRRPALYRKFTQVTNDGLV